MPGVRLRRGWAIVLAAALLTLVLPGAVAAHAELVTASPPDKATVSEAVTEVFGIYSEAMTPNGSSIIVKDAGGTTVAQGTVDPAKDVRMVATPAAPLGDGVYTVQWTSVSTDNHIERGTWTFTVAIAATPSPSPTPAPTPSPAASAPAATATPTATPSPAPTATPSPVPSATGDATSGGGSDVILPIVIALIVLGAGAVYLLRQRNRPSGTA
jgi:methionine-rich copper-binding protein CopC